MAYESGYRLPEPTPIEWRQARHPELGRATRLHMQSPVGRPRRRGRRPIWIHLVVLQSTLLRLTTCPAIIPPSAELVKLTRTLPSCVPCMLLTRSSQGAACGYPPTEQWSDPSSRIRGWRCPAPYPDRATAPLPLLCQSVRPLLPRPALLPTKQAIGVP